MKKPAQAKIPFDASGGQGVGKANSDQPGLSQSAKPHAARKPKARGLSASALSSSSSLGSEKTRIEYLNPAAREVFIAGTFNQWDPRASALTTQGEGKWGVELALPPGRHEYRFVVDGQWIEDPKASEYTGNPYGERNSVLQITARM